MLLYSLGTFTCSEKEKKKKKTESNILQVKKPVIYVSSFANVHF